MFDSRSGPVTAIERAIGIGRSGPNAEIGSQLEDLRVHVLRCERWARFDDRLDLAVRTTGLSSRDLGTLLTNPRRDARTDP